MPLTLPPAGQLPGEADEPTGYAFISYVREDSAEVDALQRVLEAAGVRVWRDTSDVRPGADWRASIRDAITRNALVFIACFSSRSAARDKSYQNEELALAVDQLRLRRPDVPWLIPVRFDDCAIPEYDIGGGRTLASIQRVDIFGDRREEAVSRLVAAVLWILGPSRSVLMPDSASESQLPRSEGQASALPGDVVAGQREPSNPPVIAEAAANQAASGDLPTQGKDRSDKPADHTKIEPIPRATAWRSVVRVIKGLPDWIIKAGAVVTALTTVGGAVILLLHLLESHSPSTDGGGHPTPPSSQKTGPTNQSSSPAPAGQHLTTNVRQLPDGSKLTTYSLPPNSSPAEITVTPDGNAWFAESGDGRIGEITPNGVYSPHRLPNPSAHPFGITTAPNGLVWFTDGNPDNFASSGNAIGFINTQGQTEEFPIPTPDSAPVGITSGPNGSMWFTEYNGRKIGSITITSSGPQINECGIPSGGQPDQITLGPDRELWFTEYSTGLIGQSPATGPCRITEHNIGIAGNPVDIISHAGKLWLTEFFADRVGVIDTQGNVTSWVTLPTGSRPANLAAGPKNGVWFTEFGAGRIGYIATPGSVQREYTVADSSSQLLCIEESPDGSVWFTVQGISTVGHITHS
jgi:virginiamycin B lyase